MRKVRGRTVVLSHMGTAHDDLILHTLIDKTEGFLGLDAQMSLDTLCLMVYVRVIHRNVRKPTASRIHT